MKVVSVTTQTRFGGNGAPRSGYVTFDDGKEYGWHKWEAQPKYWEEHIKFYGSKLFFADSPSRYRQKFSFRSKKREEALEAWLKENG